MKTTTFFLAVLLVSLTDACETSPEAPEIILVEAISGPEAEIAAIRQLGDRLGKALEQGDMDALMDGFSDDVVVIPQGHPVLKGKAAVRVYYRTLFEKYELRDFGPTLEELVVCGDWAFSRGTANFLVVSKHHRDETVTGFSRGMEIWKKQADGSWKLARAVGNR